MKKNMKGILKHLYRTLSPSGEEYRMKALVKNFALRCGADVTEDKTGNLLITKGVAETYPCIAAHLDQVQSSYAPDYKVILMNDTLFGWSDKEHKQQGLGADDKNGIFIALYCLQKFDAIKIAFFVSEEVGCVGSNKVNLDFFLNCRFIIQPDRQGGHDLITSMSVGDVCSEDFKAAIASGAQQHGYVEEIGSITDVGELVERGVGISCLNLSCGYYHPHTHHEVTIYSELINCLHFVVWIVEHCTDVYPHEYQAYYNHYYWWKDKDYGSGYKSSYYGGYDEDAFNKFVDYLMRNEKATYKESKKALKLKGWDYDLQAAYDDARWYLGLDYNKK